MTDLVLLALLYAAINVAIVAAAAGMPRTEHADPWPEGSAPPICPEDRIFFLSMLRKRGYLPLDREPGDDEIYAAIKVHLADQTHRPRSPHVIWP